MVHEKGFLLVWTRMCFFRLPFRAKDRLQKEHGNGFSFLRIGNVVSLFWVTECEAESSSSSDELESSKGESLLGSVDSSASLGEE